jgi:hypothetical protein
MYLVYSRQHQERRRWCPFHPGIATVSVNGVYRPTDENGVPPEISKKLSGERAVQIPLPLS